MQKTLDPRVSFTRAGSAANAATFVDSSGLIKTAVTNLLVQSEDFSTTWVRSGVLAFGSGSIVNAIAAPNGTLTADKIVEDTSTGNHFMQGVVSNALGLTTYTCSVFAKAAERTTLVISLGEAVWTGSTYAVASFNLSNGTSAPIGGTITSSIVPVGDGWYRCSVTATTIAGTTLLVPRFFLNGSGVYTGNGTSGLYLWGAQLEQASTVGDYVSTGAAINSAPRFDHNPTTGESLGLLVEEARTNLLLRSEAIATSPWFPGANTTLTNNTGEVLDPAGGSTATKVLVSGGAGAFGQGATLTAAIHTGSIWLRCSTGTISASLIVYLSGSPFTNIGTTNVTITTFWQRFTVVTSTATAAAYNLQLNAIAVGTVYAWGAQLEAGAFPTSYIPTTTATVTRAADVASITGANFSSFYNQTEGTVFEEVAVAANSFATYASIDNGTTTQNSTYLDNDSGNIRAVTFSSSTAVSVLVLGAVGTAGLFNKLSSTYKVNDFAAVRSGGTVQVDTSGAVPVSLTQLCLGRAPSGLAVTYINGTIKRLTYWPVRLGNNVLQQITQ
jgi:hypothetical protein